ncbi:tigger transposable element-derived protein 4-like [Colias croceus]|uniref:tigger transposable element-derived protein 4-like n=1 Tax=Colias crocea TaxID=72248 RepID=UPI001E27F3C1|nr:tigger transposable element-derived protein 4-like [Colias croceus]
MTTIKRKALSIQEKIKILNVFDKKSQTKNQTQLAAELQLPVSTLRTILKNREEIKEKYRLGGVQRKKQKVGKFDKLEKVLVEWFHQARALKLPISGPIICEKARKIAECLQIADFNASNGWIDRFKNRHGIVYRQISGESETVAQQDVDRWMATLPELLQNYEPRDIFNAGEFGLFFKLMPDKSYVFKGETCHDGKASKERLTVPACANSDGSEKLRLLVIGKAKNPRCFKNVRSLPVTYDAQSRSWMTAIRFIDWLKALDDHLQIKCRRIILFIDNCPAHPKGVELNNIKLVYLPPNSTSKLQPMDQGIIKVLKQGYRTRLVHRYLREIEDPDSKRPLTVHDAILNIAAAWEAIKPETIQNCFKKSGFRNNEVEVVLEEEEPVILQGFPGYSSIDDNVASYEIQSIEDLIENVNNTQEEAESDNDQEDESTPILSHAQALSAVNDLRRYVTSLNQSEDALQKLNYVENLVISNASKSFCRTKISDYFK